MQNKTFIFIAGLHRSGTSLLHEIIRSHPAVSGFRDTGFPEDEGQHLQTVYQPAYIFGGPGKFVFDERSYMDENHELVSENNANIIFNQWSKHWDTESNYLIEKSPPNLLRTRFLQALFPNSYFVVILRHPIAVSYATQKWSKTTIKSLLNHTLIAYNKFLDDKQFLHNVYVLRYEDLVVEPQKILDKIFDFLGLESILINKNIRKDINQKYFKAWQNDRKNYLNRLFSRIPSSFEKRACNVGYSLERIEELPSQSWLGAQSNGAITE